MRRSTNLFVIRNMYLVHGRTIRLRLPREPLSTILACSVKISSKSIILQVTRYIYACRK